MKAELRYSSDPVATWDTFRREIGDETIKMAYARRVVLGFPLPNEDMWDVLVDGCLAGWGGLAPSWDRCPEIAVGVLPNYSKQGLRNQIKELVAEEARKMGAKAVKTTVSLANKPQMKRVLRESFDQDAKFKYAGMILLPKPGYCQFVWTF